MAAKGRWRATLSSVGLGALLVLQGCGGGDTAADDNTSLQSTQRRALALPTTPSALPAYTNAHRLLNQAAFGASQAAVDQVQAAGGPAAWIEQQLAVTTPVSTRARWEAADAAAKALDPNSGANTTDVYNALWQQALAGDDQLRQRVAYALSQIFVISFDSALSSYPRGVASWHDMLAERAFGNFRNLLEGVARHPMMGLYLSHLRNQKADPKTGRVPDENFAREVMQLFTIGQVHLDSAGLPHIQRDGTPNPTYTQADIAGLAKVFTGWSWACPDAPQSGCFYNGSYQGRSDPDRAIKLMVGYPAFHSTEEKQFLGRTIPAQTVADPAASLKVALDTLFQHANVGPFIGRQLIQRLVTSNPSPAYVRAVASAFDNNGSGVRGDMKAVIRAILLHPEARNVPTGNTAGKLREPVLRATALLRAFDYRSDSGLFRLGDTSNPGTALGQVPLKAPSVFNFYRPGYVPPGTQAAQLGLAVPEMQLMHETSAAGYVNYTRNAISSGLGSYSSTFGRADVQPNFAPELALADQPGALVDQVALKLMGAPMPAALRTEVVTAVTAITVPTPTSTNATQVANARRNRVNAAVFLTAVSPEFQIQK
ncbi:MAG: DUF1800 domain-containing protein [Burkholderiales bacterium]|nr:DUF1800 domain-containing protein [Burkholderiales bacterium]